MTKFTKIAVIPLLLLLFTTAQSFAEYTTDKAKFMAEYPDLMLQDFSGTKVGPGIARKCESPMNTFSDDDCVSPGDIYSGLEFAALQPPGIRLSMVGQGGFAGASNTNTALATLDKDTTFSIRFDERHPVNVVGLSIGCFASVDDQACNNRTLEVRTFGFNQGPSVGTFELTATDEFDTFLGISFGEPISFIQIRPVDPNQEIGITPGVDAVYFGLVRNVPTMSEWAMIATVAGFAIIGFVVLHRRRKALN